MGWGLGMRTGRGGGTQREAHGEVGSGKRQRRGAGVAVSPVSTPRPAGLQRTEGLHPGVGVGGGSAEGGAGWRSRARHWPHVTGLGPTGLISSVPPIFPGGTRGQRGPARVRGRRHMSGRRGHGWPGAFPSVAFTRSVTTLPAGQQADRMFSPGAGSPEGWDCPLTSVASSGRACGISPAQGAPCWAGTSTGGFGRGN